MQYVQPPINPFAMLPMNIGDSAKEHFIIPYSIINIHISDKNLTLFTDLPGDGQFVFQIPMKKFLRDMKWLKLFCQLNDNEAVNVYKKKYIDFKNQCFVMNNNHRIKYNKKTLAAYRKMMIRIYKGTQLLIRFPYQNENLLLEKVLFTPNLP
jgi:hypothetical protein